MSTRPNPGLAPGPVERGHHPGQPDLVAVDGRRHPGLEPDHDLAGAAGRGRRDRPLEGVLGRGQPRVLEHPGLDGPAPQVLVDRVRLVPGDPAKVEAVLVGVGDRLGPAHGRVPDRGQDLQLGGQGAAARPRTGPGRCPCRCSRGPPRPPPGAAPPRPAAGRSAAATGPRPAGSGPRRGRWPGPPGPGTRPRSVLGVHHHGVGRPRGHGAGPAGVLALADVGQQRDTTAPCSWTSRWTVTVVSSPPE